MSKKREALEAVVRQYGSVEAYPLLAPIPPELRRSVAGRIGFYSRRGWFSRTSFCYFRIPKAANSTIVLTLAGHAGLIHGRRFDVDPERWSDAAKSKLRRLPSMEDVAAAYKFTFVRNPTTRILSAFLDKFSEERAPRYAGKVGLTPPCTFLEFLKALEAGGLHRDVHWAPQVDLIPYPIEQLDFVGRVENLEADLRHVVEAVFKRPLNLREKREGRTGADRAVSEFLGTEEKALIERLYARDFEAFYPEG